MLNYSFLHSCWNFGSCTSFTRITMQTMMEMNNSNKRDKICFAKQLKIKFERLRRDEVIRGTFIAIKVFTLSTSKKSTTINLFLLHCTFDCFNNDAFSRAFVQKSNFLAMFCVSITGTVICCPRQTFWNLPVSFYFCRGITPFLWFSLSL